MSQRHEAVNKEPIEMGELASGKSRIMVEPQIFCGHGAQVKEQQFWHCRMAKDRDLC